MQSRLNANKGPINSMLGIVAIDCILMTFATISIQGGAQAETYKNKITCDTLINIAKDGGSIQVNVAVLSELCSSIGIEKLAKAVGDHPAVNRLTLHSNPDHLLNSSLMSLVSKYTKGKATFVFD